MPFLTAAVTALYLIAAPPASSSSPLPSVVVTTSTNTITTAQWADGKDIETEGHDGPVMGRWWFWIVAGTVAATVVATGVLITQREEFVPDGELGVTRTDRDWTALP